MKYYKFINLHKKPLVKIPQESLLVEDFDDITDEIEKSLVGMKGFCDISEQEIDEAIKTRRKFRLFTKRS
jgi:hypothetical protein|tara:strand:- start:587 stop:796 length:210 start_codon:yes stop_codon:yes gene_type:complete